MTLTTTGVHWTQFPASALTDHQGLPLNWADHSSAHKAVSRLFPAQLPGEAGARRAEAGILYRIDTLQGVPTVLIQSRVAPALAPIGARSVELSERAWTFRAGDRIAFRVAVNPISRTTRYYEDDAKKTPTTWSNEAGHQGQSRIKAHAKRTARVVPADEVGDWLSERLGAALTDVQIMDHRRDKTGSGPHRLAVDTIDAVAIVSDPAEFDRLRSEGVGRSKSYGCGLLTARRLAEPE